MTMRILRMPDVEKKVGLRKSAIYKRIQLDTFPRPIPIGGISGWLESDIDAWIMQQVDNARAGRNAA